jgi:hypothetical protein
MTALACIFGAMSFITLVALCSVIRNNNHIGIENEKLVAHANASKLNTELVTMLLQSTIARLKEVTAELAELKAKQTEQHTVELANGNKIAVEVTKEPFTSPWRPEEPD